MEKNAFVGRMVVGVALVAGAGCADVATPGEGDTQGASLGLTIDRHDARTLQGSFVDADTTIVFDAKATPDGRATLSFLINGKELGYEGLASTSDRHGWYRVQADTAFDAVDIAGAHEAVVALTEELGHDSTALSLFEASVPKMAFYISNLSPGEFFKSYEQMEFAAGVAVPKMLGLDGAKCIVKGNTETAYYDKDVADTRTPLADGMGPSAPSVPAVEVAMNAVPPIGVYAQPALVGSNWGRSNYNGGDYDCMGLCGGGCQKFFRGGWTLDCLEHDVCSHNLGASGGGSDKNCGDEYKDAQANYWASCSGT